MKSETNHQPLLWLVFAIFRHLRLAACYNLLLVALISPFFTSTLWAQSPEDMVKKDYPKLYNDFKSEVGSQKARYVFAIDISNSMKPYEAAVKANLQNFVNALPDGDFVTIIQMASMQETRSIVENQPVNASTRRLILSYISGLNFNKVGSDGFTMTSKIIESMNQTGSSDDMKYVFMFTDFEYWTKENQFNKNAVQWASQGKKIKGKDGFLKVYGLELFQNGGANIRKDAVYKDELQQIFGKVEYVGGDNSSFLNTWFINTKANILNDRLQYVLKRKTEKENAALILKASGLGNDLSVSLKEEKMSAVYTTAELDAASLAEVQKTSEKRPLIGAYTPTPTTLTVKAKLRSPKYKNEQKSTANNEYNEADKLLDPLFAEYKIEVYEGKPYLPWYIGWPLVAVLGFWILSILNMIFIKKVTRTWSVRGTIKENNGTTTPIKSATPTNPTSFTIGRSNAKANFHVNIDGVGFCFKFESRKNISCLPLPGLKSGYYISNVGTGNAELEDAFKKKTALGNNNFKFLSKPGAFKPVTLKIKEGNKEFEFKIQ